MCHICLICQMCDIKIKRNILLPNYVFLYSQVPESPSPSDDEFRKGSSVGFIVCECASWCVGENNLMLGK